MMKVFVLALLLVLLPSVHAKLRHLRNFTIQVTSPPILSCLNTQEIAYETGNSIRVFDVNKKIITQTVVSDTTPSMQIFGQKSQILYKFNSSIFQLSSKVSDFSVKAGLKSNSWVLPVTINQKVFALPQIDTTNKKKSLEFVDYKLRKNFSLEWNNRPNENIRGPSSATLMDNGDFYILSGGECQGGKGHLYLWKGFFSNLTIAIRVTNK